MTSENTFIFKFLLICTLMFSYRAYQEIKVYRLIQYQQDEKLIGSQYTSLSYVGSHYKGDLLRKIVVLKLIEMTSLEELKSYINSNCNAVLIILSKPEKMSAKLIGLLSQIQMFFVQETFFIPIYFSYESDELNEIYEDLKSEIDRKPSTENLGVLGNFVLENLTQFNLNSNDGKKQETIQLENLYGYLEGNNSNGSNNPIIMIVANYDNLSIIPDLPSGLNKNASGVIVLLEIMRIMSKLYENYSNLINYDLLFLLSSGGSLNYQGSNHFINNLDSNTIENIHFTLCLDSLGQSEDEINLHLSRFPKQEDEVGHKFQKALNNTAINMELNLNYNKKKIFLADKHVPWEHEEYAKKKILSATLSGRKDVSKAIFESENILDIETSSVAIKKTTLLILDSLFNIIFDNESPGIFKDDPAVIDNYNIEFLTAFFKNYSRTPLNIVKNSFMNNELFSILQTYLKRSSRQSFEYKDLKFFDSNSGVIRVNIVKSKLIDMYLLFAIVVYLSLLYVSLKGFKESINSIYSFGDE